jgi:hypothetical protein
VNGGSASGSLLFSNNEETYGVSGGKVFGGEISATINTETGESTQNSTANLGPFFLKNEVTKDADGNNTSNQYMGVSFGVSAGVFIGYDISLTIEGNISRTNVPEGEVAREAPSVLPQDNTRVILPKHEQLKL